MDNEIDCITGTPEVSSDRSGLPEGKQHLTENNASEQKAVSPHSVIINNDNCLASDVSDICVCISEDTQNESNASKENPKTTRTFPNSSRILPNESLNAPFKSHTVSFKSGNVLSKSRNVSFKSRDSFGLSRTPSRTSVASQNYSSNKVADAGNVSVSMPRQLSWAPSIAMMQYDDQQYEGRLKCSQVIAVLCGCISIMLLMLSIAATTWLEADGRREGLWELCMWRDSKGVEVDCQRNNPKTWLNACRSLCLIALFSALVSVVIACIGLKTENFQWKYHYYRASMTIMFLAVIFEIIALIIFPVKFLEEIDERPYKKWEFGWAYGIGWGAAIFMFGCAILLLLDRDSEEVVYREKTIYQREPEPEEV